MGMARLPGWSYNSKYHTNERFAQVLMSGPRVPHRVLFILKAEYFLHPAKYPSVDELTKRDISVLCRNTVVPPIYETIFESKDRHTPFRSCVVYAERWYYVKKSLGGSVGALPNKAEEDMLKRACGMAQDKWNLVRHEPSCKNPGIRCHRKPPFGAGCRKNFPNLYFIMAQLCVLLELDHLLHLFPVNNQPKTLKKLNQYWQRICYCLNWKYIPWDGRSKSHA